MEEIEGLLTGFGLSVMEKQMVAGGNYGAAEVSLTSMEDDDLPYVDLRPFPAVDPDLANHSRFHTLEELRSSIPVPQQAHVRCFKVSILHTVTNKPTNPHFILLRDKVEGRARMHVRIWRSLWSPLPPLLGSPAHHYYGHLPPRPCQRPTVQTTADTQCLHRNTAHVGQPGRPLHHLRLPTPFIPSTPGWPQRCPRQS